MGVGMPHQIYLKQFGDILRGVFGHDVYHVGSSLMNKDGWRDVDVRAMIPGAEYEAMGFGDPKYPQQNRKWVGMCLAFSALGKQMTGLPIDFQIQPIKFANEQEHGSRGWLATIHVDPETNEFDKETVKMFDGEKEG